MKAEKVENNLQAFDLWKESCLKVELGADRRGGRGADMKLYWNQNGLTLNQGLMVHFRVYPSNIK